LGLFQWPNPDAGSCRGAAIRCPGAAVFGALRPSSLGRLNWPAGFVGVVLLCFCLWARRAAPSARGGRGSAPVGLAFDPRRACAVIVPLNGIPRRPFRRSLRPPKFPPWVGGAQRFQIIFVLRPRESPRVSLAGDVRGRGGRHPSARGPPRAANSLHGLCRPPGRDTLCFLCSFPFAVLFFSHQASSALPRVAEWKNSTPAVDLLVSFAPPAPPFTGPLPGASIPPWELAPFSNNVRRLTYLPQPLGGPFRSRPPGPRP